MRAGSDVTVVIPNYNGMAYIEACLKALLKDAPEAEILVVDNASSDGSRELVKEKFPAVRVLALDKNYGFSRAVNEGIRASSRPYVILLNNDTEVLPGFTENLAEVLREDESVFSASAKLISLSDPEKIDDAGNFYCALGWAFARGKDKSVAYYEEQDEIFSACAGAAVYRKRLFDEIGLFDEAHFAYLEDVDVGWRARIAGYRNVYAPKAKVLHAGSGSSGSRYNEFKIRLSSRNNIYLLWKNMPFLQIVLNLPFLLPGFLLKQLFFIKKGYGKLYAKGLLEGLRMCRGDRKVKFSCKNLSSYVKIQIELWINIAKRFG